MEPSTSNIMSSGSPDVSIPQATADSREKDRYRSEATKCPICGGWDGLKRHQSIRCYGYTLGNIAYCTRITAGNRPQNCGNAYPHVLRGLCDCGETHDQRPAARKAAQRAAAKSPKPFNVPPDKLDGYKLSAWYWYFDEQRQPREWIFRYEQTLEDGSIDKTFRQAKVNADGQGEWKLGSDFERVLYRLPELLAADPALPVYICEGEKDVDRLVALGQVATSSPEGAGKWGQIKDASVWLRSRHVVIIEDNDLAGQRHTAAIVASLQGIAQSLAVVQFPDKPAGYDVSDWLDAGGDVADLPGMTQPIGGSIQDDSTPPDDSEVATLREACRRMNEKLRWIYEVLETPGERMSPTEKIAVIMLRREIEWKDTPKRDEDGHAPIYLAQLSEKTGTSTSTASKSLTRLEAVGAVTVKRLTVATPTGRETRLSVAPGPTIDKPREWMPSEGPRKHGGKRAGAGRKVCRECGSPEIESQTFVQTIRRTLTETRCRACGSVTRENQDEIVSEVKAEAPNQVESIPPSEDAQQDTPLPQLLRDQQVATTPLRDESEAGCNHLEFTPPIALVNPRDPENTYRKRVQAYLDAGLTVIEATRRVEAENRLYWAQLEETQRQDVS